MYQETCNTATLMLIVCVDVAQLQHNIKHDNTFYWHLTFEFDLETKCYLFERLVENRGTPNQSRCHLLKDL